MRRGAITNADGGGTTNLFLGADGLVVLVKHGAQIFVRACGKAHDGGAQCRELQDKYVVAFLSRAAQLGLDLLAEYFDDRGIAVGVNNVIANRALD